MMTWESTSCSLWVATPSLFDQTSLVQHCFTVPSSGPVGHTTSIFTRIQEIEIVATVFVYGLWVNKVS
uniref:Uncharacterized protein n=1 Tax=Cucumis melo TaxID=3656 RepID=A0A9I9E4H7_CUCME